jgi:NADPH:quinone reductase-like Zn-dependent oxidoreductase
MQSVTWKFEAYGEPDQVLAQVKVALDAPAAGKALVKIRAIGMNRSELNYVRGKYLPARNFPSALGQEAVGEIVALGEPADDEAAHSFAVGDRVALTPGRVDMCGTGTYRDYGIYDQKALIPVPDNYSDEEGAAFWMAFLTVAGSLHNAGMTAKNASGKTLLVTAAASSVGVMALKIARLWGARTLATTRSSAKIDVLEQLADKVLICERGEQLAEQLKTSGGFDFAIDPVGGDFIDAMVACANHGAAIVSYEMIAGGRPEYSIAQVLVKDLTIRGFALFNIFRQPGLCEELVEKGLQDAKGLVPVIAGTFTLEDAPSALHALDASRHIGKLVLLPS